MQNTENITAQATTEDATGFSVRATILICILWLAGFLLVMMISSERLRDDVLARLEAGAMQMRETINAELGPYENIASGIARMRTVKDALNGKQDGESLKRFLQRANEDMKTEALIVISPSGFPVAASKDFGFDFEHRDFSFRPYFQQAMLGERGHYYASGFITGERGYFFSAPVYDNGNIIGVVVVKANLEPILYRIKEYASDYMIVGYDGVVFAASRGEWVYNTLYPLAETQRLAIHESRRYPRTSLVSLSTESLDSIFHSDQVVLNSTGLANRYFARRTRLPDLGWHIFALVPSSVLFQDVAVYLLYYTLAFALLFLLWLYQRKRTEVQRHVAVLNSELERRVALLTSELKESNEELQELVDHYRTTQEQLTETRGQLVQTAKLAVLGEMSAGINHELSQPLLALNTYIENSQRLLDKGQYEKVSANLGELQQVVGNMRDIVSRFKVFARRTPPEPRPFGLQEVLSGTRVIMTPLLKKSALDFRIRQQPDIPELFGDPVQVQQVLVNLVTNAADALEEEANGWIAMDIRAATDEVEILVTDSGPGIAEELRDKIFEPFFTTKARGLGLGLALSRRIIETLGGSLTLKETAAGGTCFVLTLPVYRHGETA